MRSEFPIELYRHVKTGGVYQFMCEAETEVSGERVVVYKCLRTGSAWTRPKTEFEQRFERCGSVNK